MTPVTPEPQPTEPESPWAPFGDLFDKAADAAGRSPFYDLESHFWARDQQRDLMRVASGWWAMAWFCSSYSEELARKLGNKARVYEARAERLTYSEWAISASTTLVGAAVALIGSFLFLRPQGKS